MNQFELSACTTALSNCEYAEDAVQVKTSSKGPQHHFCLDLVR
jgi:hypothetical protein